MRAEDHQMIGPLFILSLVKAGQPGVTYDEEKTGYGWKTEAFIDAKGTIPPVRCCQFPAYRSQFVFGVMAPVDCRHKGATSFSA